MTLTDLIQTVAEKNKLSAPHVKFIANNIFGEITDALTHGEQIQIVGFGTFKVTEKNPREGRNPRTGEKIFIPAHKSVHFSAGKSLKDTVNQ